MSEHTFYPATVNEYLAWVWQHIESGGTVTNWYDYPMSRAGILVAQEYFELPPGYGVGSKDIIVPEGVEWSCVNSGHSVLYLPGGRIFASMGAGVPAYNDQAFHDLPGYQAGMAETRERHRKIMMRLR